MIYCRANDQVEFILTNLSRKTKRYSQNINNYGILYIGVQIILERKTPTSNVIT